MNPSVEWGTRSVCPLLTAQFKSEKLSLRLVSRQREVEATAAAYLAFYPDAAAVLDDDAAADGEAEAGAAHGAGVGGVDLLEAFEDHVFFVLGDAAAFVADAQADEAFFRGGGEEADY